MISAVVNTYNEEANIHRCLESLSWVDEVVVVDMGSTDATRSIATEMGARVIDHHFTGYVEPARNTGIERAKGEWILIVDADEQIPTTLIRYLQHEGVTGGADYLRIPRKNIIFGKWIRHSGWWPDYQIRFFRKGAVVWTDTLHAVPTTRGVGREADSREELAILHNHYQTVSQYLERLNRYTGIAAAQALQHHEKFSPTDLIEKPTKEFIRRYFFWEGYKDGMHGLALSLLQACSEFVVCLKMWELRHYEPKTLSLDTLVPAYIEHRRQMFHWISTIMGGYAHNLLTRLMWRIRRKFSSYV